ncbi:MAG: MCE family protein [Rhodospirillales bacterium]|nr:MCE family protein [Rhodospirillales bacterium]
MSQQTKEIFAGALAVAVLALVFVYFYGGREWTAEAAGGSYRLTATFNKVDGLLTGDQVQLGGIRIGRVDRQALDQSYRAVVTFKIDSWVRLPADTSVAIHTDGLFGSKFVVLEPGGEEEHLKDGDHISYAQEAVIVSDLLDMIIAEGKSKRKKSP